MEKFCQCESCGGLSNIEKAQIKNSKKNLETLECTYCKKWIVVSPEKTKCLLELESEIAENGGKKEEVTARRSRPATLDECVDIAMTKNPKADETDICHDVEAHSVEINQLKNNYLASTFSKIHDKIEERKVKTKDK